MNTNKTAVPTAWRYRIRLFLPAIAVLCTVVLLANLILLLHSHLNVDSNQDLTIGRSVDDLTPIFHGSQLKYHWERADSPTFALQFPNNGSIWSQDELQGLGRSSRVIAFSLYGSNDRYLDGVESNIRLAKTTYTGWTIRIYHDDTVPGDFILRILQKYGLNDVNFVNVSKMDPNISSLAGTKWRFLIVDDESVEYFLIRDIDSRLTRRDAVVTRHWMMHRVENETEESDVVVIIRDNLHHNKKHSILAGMWGGYGPGLRRLLRPVGGMGTLLTVDPIARAEQDRNADQDFLQTQIWPRVRSHAAIYDSHMCGGDVRPFPAQRTGAVHVGQVVLDHDTSVILPMDLDGHIYLAKRNGDAKSPRQCYDRRALSETFDCVGHHSTVNLTKRLHATSWIVASSDSDGTLGTTIVSLPCIVAQGQFLANGFDDDAIAEAAVVGLTNFKDLSVIALFGSISYLDRTLSKEVPIIIPSLGALALLGDLLDFSGISRERVTVRDFESRVPIRLAYLVSGSIGAACVQARRALHEALRFPVMIRLEHGHVLVVLASQNETASSARIRDYASDYFLVEEVIIGDGTLVHAVAKLLMSCSVIVVVGVDIPLAYMLFLPAGTVLKALDDQITSYHKDVDLMAHALSLQFEFIPKNATLETILLSVVSSYLH